MNTQVLVITCNTSVIASPVGATLAPRRTAGVVQVSGFARSMTLEKVLDHHQTKMGEQMMLARS